MARAANRATIFCLGAAVQAPCELEAKAHRDSGRSRSPAGPQSRVE